MPQTVDLGPYGLAEFPDNFSQDQMESVLRASIPTFPEQLSARLARPAIPMPDGSRATVRSIGVGDARGEWVIPTIVDGKPVSDDEARQLWKAGKNAPLAGPFATPEEGNDFAKRFHLAEEKRIAQLPDVRQPNTPTNSDELAAQNFVGERKLRSAGLLSNPKPESDGGVAGLFARTLNKAGQVIYGGLVDLGSDVTGQSLRAADNNEGSNIDAALKGEELPAELQAKSLPTPLRVANAAAAGLVKTAPQLAAVTGAQAVGIPAPLAAAAVFGSTPEGFSLKQAGIAAALPFVGKYTGEITASIAQKLGVSSEQALKIFQAAGGVAGAAGYLGTIQASEIANLPPEQQKDAIIDALGNIIGQSALGIHAGELRPELVVRNEVAKAMNEPRAGAPTSAGIPLPTPDIGMRNISEVMEMSPEQLVQWKRENKYGPETSKQVATTINPDDLQSAMAMRDRLRAQVMEMLKYTRPDDDRAMMEANSVGVKAQTINEIIQDYAALDKNRPAGENFTDAGASETNTKTIRPEAKKAPVLPDVGERSSPVLRPERGSSGEVAGNAPGLSVAGQGDLRPPTGGQGLSQLRGMAGSPSRNAAEVEAVSNLQRAVEQHYGWRNILRPNTAGLRFSGAGGGSGEGPIKSGSGATFDGSRDIEIISTLEKALGKTIIGVDGGEKLPWNGLALDSSPHTLFVDVRSSIPIHAIIGHEFFESMALTDRPTALKMAEEILPLLHGVEKYQDILNLAYESKNTPHRSDLNEARKETIANFVGDSFTKPEFWDKLSKSNPTVFERAATLMRDLIAKLLNALSPFKSERFYTDIERAEGIVIDAINRHVASGNRLEAAGGKPQLSIEPFKNEASKRKMTEALGLDAAGKATLDLLAAVQAGDVKPDTRELIIQRAFTEPKTVAEAVAKRLIKRTADILSASDTPRNFSTIQDPVARRESAVISTDRHILLGNERNKIETAKLKAEAAMEAAVKDMPKVDSASLGLDMLRSMSESLPKEYERYLRNLSATSSPNSNLGATAALLLKRASQQAGGWVVSPGAIERAIQEIANNPRIKTGAEVAPVAGVAERFYPPPSATEFLNRVRFEGRLKGVNTEAQLALLGGPDGKALGGVDPLLARIKNLPEVVEALRKINDNSAQATREVVDFQKSFNPSGKAVGVGTAMKRYAKMVMQSKTADTIVKTLNRNYEKARNELLGSDEAHSLINEVLDSPDYKQSVSEAAKVIGVRLDGLYNAVEGEFRTLGPYPEQKHDFIITRKPTAENQIKNRIEAERLMSDIDALLQDPAADPIHKASWEQIGQMVQAQWLENINNPIEARKLGVEEPADIKHWLGVVAHTRTPHELISDKIGGAETLDLRRSMSALDALTQKVRGLEVDAESGRKAISLKMAQGATSHGYDIKNNPGLAEEYRANVLNPIAESLQHYGSIPLRVGDFIPFTATKVTREDMNALEALHKFEQGVRKISEQDMRVYGVPTKILDEFGGKSFERESTTTGPMMMSRFFNAPDWLFSEQGLNWRTGLTGDVRQAQVNKLLSQMWTDPQMFKDIVLSYISETSPEFNKSNLFEKEFRQLTNKAKSQAVQIDNFDDLVDAIAPMRKETREDVSKMLKEDLEREAVRVLDGFAGEVAADLKPKDANAFDRAIYSSMRTEGSFLKPRGRMVAPSSFYTYAKIADSDVMLPAAVAVTIARARNLERLKQVLSAYSKHLDDLNQQIDSLVGTTNQKTGKPTTRKEAIASIDSKVKLGEYRYEYSMLKRRVDQLQAEANMSENLLTKFEEAFPSAISKTALTLNRAIALQLLGSIRSSLNNLVGATGIQNAFIESQLGNWNDIVMSPLRTTKVAVRVTMARTLNAIAKSNPKLRGAVDQALQAIDPLAEVMAEHINTVKDMQETGMLPRFDWKNKRAAKRALGFGGEIIKPGTEVGAVPQFVQWASTTPPGLLQEMIFPRATDSLANEVNAVLAKSKLLKIFSKASDIGDVRTRNGQKLNPADPSQFISHKEMELSASSWENLKKLVEPVGSMESLLFDYYNRLKQADATGAPRDQVPIMSPDKLQALLLQFGKLGNVVLETNSPSFYRGTWLRRVFGTFSNWPANFAALVSKSIPTSLNSKEQVAMIPKLMLVASVVSAIALATKGVGGAMMPVITGKDSAEPTLTNIMQDPTSADAVRYWLGAVGAGIPYLNVVLSQASDSRSIFDLSRTVPLAGWLRDTAGLGYDAVRTGDIGKAFLDYSNRYMPLYSGAINRLPGAREQISASNTARALRAATPRSIEMRAVTGGTANPTPLSRYLRAAESAAYGGDNKRAQSALEQAIALKMKRGISRRDAMNEIRQSISARQPEMRVYGRVLAPTERKQILGRMTGRQLRAYKEGQMAYGRLLSMVPRATGQNRRRLRSAL